MAGAPSNAPQPPAPGLPFVEVHSDGRGYLTPAAFQMLQYLWSSLGGQGGLIDLSLLFVSEPVIRETSPMAAVWTPVVRGSLTAGVQTYSRQWGWSAQLGPVTVALFNVALSALDPLSDGDAQIAGLPAPLALSPAVAQPGWLSSYANIVMTTGLTQLGIEAAAGGTALTLRQSAPQWAGQPLPMTALGATSAFTGGAIFFR